MNNSVMGEGVPGRGNWLGRLYEENECSLWGLKNELVVPQSRRNSYGIPGTHVQRQEK